MISGGGGCQKLTKKCLPTVIIEKKLFSGRQLYPSSQNQYILNGSSLNLYRPVVMVIILLLLYNGRKE